MTSSKTIKAGALGGPAEWIDFLRYSLSDICARGEWDDFGIFRILNRVSFMSCQQIVFVLYHAEDGSKKVTAVNEEISAFDPLFQEQLFKTMIDKKLVHRNRKKQLIVNRKNNKNFEIRLLGTNIFMMIFKLEVTHKNPSQQAILDFKPISIRSKLGKFFKAVFEPFDGKDGRAYFSESINAQFEKLRSSGLYQYAKDPEPKPDDLSEDDLDLLADWARDINGLVEREYRRLSKSPLLRSFAAHLPDAPEAPSNLFIFSKVFARRSTRYRHYRFDPLLMMDSQSMDIAVLLARASGLAGKSDGKHNSIDRSDFIPYGMDALDNAFWSCCASQEGINHIVNAVRGPWPECVRLFTENVLMSGSTMIKPDIFDHGAIGWIDESLAASAEEIDNARFRLVCLHYVMQLASPVRPSKAKNLSIVSLPFRCSGAIWMCASYVRENPCGEVLGLIDQQGFMDTFLIYHSLLRESERRLRTKAKDAYINVLSELIADETAKCLERVGAPSEAFCLDRKSINSFNRKSKLLCRLYPFELMKLAVSRKENFIPLHDVRLGNADNPHFDRLSLYRFIDEEDAMFRLRDQICLAALRRNVDDRSFQNG